MFQCLSLSTYDVIYSFSQQLFLSISLDSFSLNKLPFLHSSHLEDQQNLGFNLNSSKSSRYTNNRLNEIYLHLLNKFVRENQIFVERKQSFNPNVSKNDRFIMTLRFDHFLQLSSTFFFLLKRFEIKVGLSWSCVEFDKSMQYKLKFHMI